MTDPANARNRLAHLSASNSKVVASMLTSVATLPAQPDHNFASSMAETAAAPGPVLASAFCNTTSLPLTSTNLASIEKLPVHRLPACQR
jgi:hypothetical protein